MSIDELVSALNKLDAFNTDVPDDFDGEEEEEAGLDPLAVVLSKLLVKKGLLSADEIQSQLDKHLSGDSEDSHGD